MYQIKSNVSLIEQLSDRNCKQKCIDKIQDDKVNTVNNCHKTTFDQ